MNFDIAFDRLLGNEGELSLDPHDRGNWTSGEVGVGELKGSKYGISAMSYPDEDIPHLSIDRARFLYKRDYWSRVHADELPASVAFQGFDFCVNSGAGTAVRYLQLAVGVADDGHWGPVTRAAAAAMSESDIIMRLNAFRLRYLTSLSSWPRQGKGWTRRIANNLLFGAEDTA